MKNLLFIIVASGLAGCSSTSEGPANYGEADRSTTTARTETVESTPEPAPIATKSGSGNDVLDHNAPDQQLAHP